MICKIRTPGCPEITFYKYKNFHMNFLHPISLLSKVFFTLKQPKFLDIQNLISEMMAYVC